MPQVWDDPLLYCPRPGMVGVPDMPLLRLVADNAPAHFEGAIARAISRNYAGAKSITRVSAI